MTCIVSCCLGPPSLQDQAPGYTGVRQSQPLAGVGLGLVCLASLRRPSICAALCPESRTVPLPNAGFIRCETWHGF